MNAINRVDRSIGQLWNWINIIYPPSKRRVESRKMLPLLLLCSIIYAGAYVSVIYMLLKLMLFNPLTSILTPALLFSLLFAGVIIHSVKSILEALRNKKVSPTIIGSNLLINYIYLVAIVTFEVTLAIILT